LSSLADPNVYLIDFVENRVKESTVLYCFDVINIGIVHQIYIRLPERSNLFLVNHKRFVFFILRYTDGRQSSFKVYSLNRETMEVKSLLEDVGSRNLKPVSFLHDEKLFIVVLDHRSYYYDIHTGVTNIFVPLTFNGGSIQDIKSIVLNKYDMFIIHCSSARHKGCIWYMDMRRMDRWVEIDIKGDTRPKDLIQYGILPYRKQDSDREICLFFGGAYNACKNCYLFDDLRHEIARCSIYMKVEDRVLTNQVYEDDKKFVCFGIEYVHIYDKESKSFKSTKYGQLEEDAELRGGTKGEKKDDHKGPPKKNEELTIAEAIRKE